MFESDVLQAETFQGALMELHNIQEPRLICGEAVQLELLELWPDEAVSDDVSQAYRMMPIGTLSKCLQELLNIHGASLPVLTNSAVKGQF